MRKFIIKISVLLLLLIASILLALYIDPDKVEIRNGFLDHLIRLTLPFWIISIILAILFFDIQAQEFIRWVVVRAIVVSIIALVDFIIILFSIGLTIWGTTEMNDAIVFQSINNSKEKIICQFYWCGIIENNTAWRIIKTNKINSI